MDVNWSLKTSVENGKLAIEHDGKHTCRHMQESPQQGTVQKYDRVESFNDVSRSGADWNVSYKWSQHKVESFVGEEDYVDENYVWEKETETRL